MPRPERLLLASALVLVLVAPRPASPAAPDVPVLRRWVEEMKTTPRGPFERIRWFCADGTVHPARPYPCAERGGGIQHGEWSARTRALRDAGYRVGNVLADLRGPEFSGPGADLAGLKQILLERFFMTADHGWIFRGARTYRGALQIEDEEAGAARVVLAMLADPASLTPPRFYLTRETVRLLPRTADALTAGEVRRMAIEVAGRDPSFEALRAKIHNAPDPEDARRVREYAAERGRPALGEDYERLADAIERLYSERGAVRALGALAERTPDPAVAEMLSRHAERVAATDDPGERFALDARLLAYYRDRVADFSAPEARRALLEASLALEDDAYAAGNELLPRLARVSRRERLYWLERGTEALYGAGLLSERHVAGVRASLARIESAAPLTVSGWSGELRYLSRVPEWAGRWIEFHFGRSVAHLAPLEPLAHYYPQDRLRGSPLLVYSALADGLVADANRLAGIEHRIFGAGAASGLRALNPGLARGPLLNGEGADLERFRRDGIYLLPETTSDLPPVAGILTRGEGSSLSHVQLLARNLGIPNVVVGESHLGEVTARLGRSAVLAVSPSGVVQLAEDGRSWDAVFGAAALGDDVVLRPDLTKLDLAATRLVPLSELRAEDSGRVSGPKGAKLGELRHHFGAQVPDGFVIPFGVFRRVLDQPLEPGGPSVWDWMRARYAAIAALSADPVRQEVVAREMLARLRAWITSADLGPAFRAELFAQLERSFGSDGSYGVFVRSDTNVEDLPGFTGAGLNLTLPNLVGREKVYDAIREVWASPFTERSYGWRQAHMELPEYVFPAVVVQLAFPSEKSGVMVTADVESGDPGWLSLAVNEGVGGAVEGQAAESLRVRADGSEVRFLAQATAPERAVLSPAGGIAKLPASGTDAVLAPGEIAQLVELASAVPSRFPELQAHDGQPAQPADIEFAFRNGRLAILQIRPLVESRSAQRNAYLLSLDEGLAAHASDRVQLDAVPETPR